jgi:hypothetical protein
MDTFTFTASPIQFSEPLDTSILGRMAPIFAESDELFGERRRRRRARSMGRRRGGRRRGKVSCSPMQRRKMPQICRR